MPFCVISKFYTISIQQKREVFFSGRRKSGIRKWHNRRKGISRLECSFIVATKKILRNLWFYRVDWVGSLWRLGNEFMSWIHAFHANSFNKAEVPPAKLFVASFFANKTKFKNSCDFSNAKYSTIVFQFFFVNHSGWDLEFLISYWTNVCWIVFWSLH